MPSFRAGQTIGHFLEGGVCDICVARACAHAPPTQMTHAFPQTALSIVSKTRLIERRVICLSVEQKTSSPLVLPPFKKAPEKKQPKDKVREATQGRFCKMVVLANVPSLRFFGSIVPFLVLLGSVVLVFVPSFRFLGSREHPPKPPFWNSPFANP